MDCVKSGTDLVATHRRKAKKSSKPKSDRIVETNSPIAGTSTSIDLIESAAFADQIRRELDPNGPLETLMAARVIQAALQLQTILDLGGVDNPGSSSASVDVAGRSLKEALESFDYVRARSNPVPTSQPVGTEIEPNEWAIVPTDGLEQFDNEPETTQDETPNWRDRLIFDFEVSEISPVVKGTWITVSHVISLIVDGWTWADILRSHPELTESDIRTCVAYAMAEENAAG